jgi:hypothetical protein
MIISTFNYFRRGCRVIYLLTTVLLAVCAFICLLSWDRTYVGTYSTMRCEHHKDYHLVFQAPCHSFALHIVSQGQCGQPLTDQAWLYSYPHTLAVQWMSGPLHTLRRLEAAPIMLRAYGSRQATSKRAPFLQGGRNDGPGEVRGEGWPGLSTFGTRKPAPRRSVRAFHLTRDGAGDVHLQHNFQVWLCLDYENPRGTRRLSKLEKCVILRGGTEYTLWPYRLEL